MRRTGNSRVNSCHGVLLSFTGLSRFDVDVGIYSLYAQLTEYTNPHSGYLRLSGARLLWSYCNRYLLVDQGIMEWVCWPFSRLLYRHRFVILLSSFDVSKANNLSTLKMQFLATYRVRLLEAMTTKALPSLPSCSLITCGSRRSRRDPSTGLPWLLFPIFTWCLLGEDTSLLSTWFLCTSFSFLSWVDSQTEFMLVSWRIWAV